MPNINISFDKVIVDMRNKVIHCYDSVDDFLVWKIVVKIFQFYKMRFTGGVNMKGIKRI
jgi:uncharacterized protein with HEPN domain